MDFSNRAAVVTGGTGALGVVVSEALFEAGAGLALPLHSEEARRRIPASIARQGDRLYAGVADVGNERSVQAFVRAAAGKFGGIHFLINLAGGYAGGSLIEEVAIEEWNSMLGSNLTTAFLMSRSVLPTMRSQGFGRIVNIAAMPAMEGGARKGPYAIAKRGVATLTETIALEVKGTGITSNAIAPSIILTDANKRSMPKADYSTWVDPREIASLILYLCTDDARSINGNVIRMYGGM